MPASRTKRPISILVAGLPKDSVESGRYTLGKPDVPASADLKKVRFTHVNSATEAIMQIRSGTYQAVIAAQELYLHSPSECSGAAIDPYGILLATEAVLHNTPCVLVAHHWKDNLPRHLEEMLSCCLLQRNVYRAPNWSEAVSLVLAE
jgi:hypothetical protein